MKPFLKWAGNKYRIVNKIRGILPPGKRLIEPFAGSAAVFLNTEYKENFINDRNTDLINVFVTLKQFGPAFIDACKSLFTPEHNVPRVYYEFREEFNATRDLFRKAALFIYLNRHGYNGLCRYNNDGGFNVPFGRYKKPYFPFDEMMMFYHKSQSATFLTEDFETVMQQAQPGDVIYCDPPYVPLSATANFTNYSAGGFGFGEQLRLAKAAREASGRGVPVLISNHQTPFTEEIYQTAQITTFDVQRLISCDSTNRNKATELLALFPALVSSVN
ncbi:Dam family site-specific DNA-(adenine-N6)-methyltransferase [Alicyclobacillus mengziensis]|nr:Dam family site-specific DNA-(adenine-N6)-methyltransferase [Alicyclobacillus mengziensis]